MSSVNIFLTLNIVELNFIPRKVMNGHRREVQTMTKRSSSASSFPIITLFKSVGNFNKINEYWI